MAKLWADKTTFGAGELSPTMARRSDTQQHADGAKRMRNVRLLNAGGFTRRPGSHHMVLVPAGSRLVEFTFSIDQLYLLVLSAGRMDAYLTDGTPAGSLAGCPWSAEDVQALTWVQAGDTVVLACRSWNPQVIQRTGAASWSLAPWTADEGPGGALLQPYYKWVAPDVTLQPDGYAGSVTLTASAPAFDTPHVGARIRYVGCEIQITSVASGTSATGTVLQTLPPSQRLTLEHTVGFRVGQVATGRETTAKGEIVAVDHTAKTIDVVITSGETPFTNGEEIDSPTGAAEVMGVTEIGPQPTRQWDEPYLSPIYGYPAAVGLHRARLWLGGHTRLPAAVLASRIGAYYNMDLGTGEDAEAIFEDLGDGAVASIKHFHSAENLLVVTDQGPYYVPETASNPIRPSSIQFHRIGADGSGAARPVAFDEGVLYRHVSGAGVMDIRPTGDNTKSWKADDLALLAAHLVRQPIDMAATHGQDGAPERYAFAVNSDGTLAVLHAIQSQQVLGWTLWETEGAYRSVAVLGGHVFAIVSRAFGGATHWCLERFDQALCLDGAAVLPTGTGAAPYLNALTVHARSGTAYLGTVTLPADGAAPDFDLGGSALELGRLFTPTVETLPPEPKLPYGGSAARVKRISRIRLYVLDAVRVRVGDRIMDSHHIGEDLTTAPPARTEWIEAAMLGRSKEPTVTITQDEPLPMTILGISMEVII